MEQFNGYTIIENTSKNIQMDLDGVLIVVVILQLLEKQIEGSKKVLNH